jgi:hypothetical protein
MADPKVDCVPPHPNAHLTDDEMAAKIRKLTDDLLAEPSDEALIDNLRDGISDDTYIYRGKIRRYSDELDAIAARLASKDAEIAEMKRCYENQLARAEKAEADIRDNSTALAECRAKTIEECARVVAEWANAVELKAPQSPTILQARMHATSIRALAKEVSHG